MVTSYVNQNSGIEIIKYFNSLKVTNFRVSLAVEYIIHRNLSAKPIIKLKLVTEVLEVMW